MGGHFTRTSAPKDTISSKSLSICKRVQRLLFVDNHARGIHFAVRLSKPDLLSSNSNLSVHTQICLHTQHKPSPPPSLFKASLSLLSRRLNPYQTHVGIHFITTTQRVEPSRFTTATSDPAVSHDTPITHIQFDNHRKTTKRPPR
jgi:hypothetical protein